LSKAFRSSDTLYFQELLNQVGKDELKIWIDTLRYGNKYVSDNVKDLMTRLKATPDEHVGIMKKLYFDQLPFSSHTQTLTRMILPSEEKINYTRKSFQQVLQELPYTIYQEIGFIEDSTNHPYFYTNTICHQGPLKDSTALLSKTTKEILASLRIFLD
jgi:beta-lactamase class D